MARETLRNEEKLKQRIDFLKENLKFLNSFYLPLLSGTVILLVSNNPMPITLRLSWILIACMAISFLTLLKFDIVDTIDRLIDEL
jgi:hypothetical protein